MESSDWRQRYDEIKKLLAQAPIMCPSGREQLCTENISKCIKNQHCVKAFSELLPKRLYFVTTSSGKLISPSPEVQVICTDKNFVYERFFSDFGPLHLGQLYRYCRMMRAYFQNNPRVCLIHSTGCDPEKRANAAFLVGAFAMLCLKIATKQILQALTQGQDTIPFKPFQDASLSETPQTITLEDCLNGLEKAHALRFFDLDDLDIDELEEKREMLRGDLNWLVPNRFLAFCGPSTEPNSQYPRPEQYLEYFHQRGVTAVVRLNHKNYDARKFTEQGIQHFDVFLVDGSTPSKNVLQEFLDISESTDGAIAVHCKAGLGRTGTLVGAYLIKHYRMTALEAIAWLRICRPGSVIGHQQTWLQTNEKYLIRQGDNYRKLMFGDADRIDLPKYGVYSKLAKRERETTATTNAQLHEGVPRNSHRNSPVFDSPYTRHSKDVPWTNRSNISPRYQIKQSDGEIRSRRHHQNTRITCLRHGKGRQPESGLIDGRYKRPGASFSRGRDTTLQSRRNGNGTHLVGNRELSNRNDLSQHCNQYDSGDVAHTGNAQGDKLNAIKLLHSRSTRRHSVPFSQRLQELASLRNDYDSEHGIKRD